jgi:segregation and condensation protein B
VEIIQAQAAIEAVLFASGEPVSVDKLAEVLEMDKPTLVKLLTLMMEKRQNEESGLRIVKLDDTYQLCTKECFAGQIRGVLEQRRNVPLSQAAMEILAIVAYNQPVTKGFIEQIRGVDSSGVVSSLVTKGLIEEKGRLELPGRPLLYGTTDNFLRCFHLTSLAELPPVQHPQEAPTEENELNRDTPEI